MLATRSWIVYQSDITFWCFCKVSGMGLLDTVALCLAGIGAGVVGSAGGITSLVSYPALLLVGLPPFAANVANMVALVACWPGSALASGPELTGKAPWLRRYVPLAAAGGLVGAVLLLVTPPGEFEVVVPYLVALGSLALLGQPAISAVAERRRSVKKPALKGGLVAISTYNGYFGAGAGVMTLALVLFAAEGHIARANALKNMLVGASSVLSAAVFVCFASVRYTAVLPLAGGLFVGATIGPRVARLMPSRLLRWLVALVGLALAVKLWVSPA